MGVCPTWGFPLFYTYFIFVACFFNPPDTDIPCICLPDKLTNSTLRTNERTNELYQTHELELELELELTNLQTHEPTRQKSNQKFGTKKSTITGLRKNPSLRPAHPFSSSHRRYLPFHLHHPSLIGSYRARKESSKEKGPPPPPRTHTRPHARTRITGFGAFESVSEWGVPF